MDKDNEVVEKKGRRTIYDWVQLKHEFLTGDWRSVREFQKSKGLTNKTSRKYRGWVREREEYKGKIVEAQTKRAIQKEVEDVSDVRARQARLSRFMQMKGAEKLKEVESKDLTPDDARKLVVTGMQEERRALGIEGVPGQGGGTFNQININAKTNFDKLIETLDYEGLIKFIANIKRERTRRTIQQDVEGGAGEIQEGETV